MFRKFFFLAFFILSLLPLTALAQSDQPQPPFPDGTTLKPKGSFQKYFFIVNGQKWPIANTFTLKELGVKSKDIVRVEKSVLSKIPDGEVLKISPPKIKGMFDMHEHFRSNGDLKLYLNIARKLGISKTVFLPTGIGPNNAGYKKHMASLLSFQKKFPDRIIAFCTVDEADSEAPKIFQECLDQGGQGMCDFSLHQEKWYRCPVMNKGQYVLLPGFELPKEVLKKIYIENPKKFLKN